jgi:hypothetical protein
VGSSAPSTPTVGDYWFDLSEQIWKRYNGLEFEDSLSALVGISVIDENGDCVAARSEDYVKPYLTINTLELDLLSVTQVRSNVGGRAGVNGVLHQYGTDSVTWDITTDLDTGTEASSVMYFFYITEEGAPKISRQAPDDFTSARGGFYHPTETWRCFGQAFNNASGDLEKVISYDVANIDAAIAESSVASNALTLSYWTSPLVQYAFHNTGQSDFQAFPIYQTLTVPSGASLGHLNQLAGAGAAFSNSDNVIMHLVKSENYMTLGVSSHQRGQGDFVNTTALDTSSDNNELYSLNAYTNVQARAVAHGTSSQTNSDLWAANLRGFNASSNINACRRKIVSISSGGLVNNTTLSSVGSTDFYLTTWRRVKVSLMTRTTSLSGFHAVRIVESSGNEADIFVDLLMGAVSQGTYFASTAVGGATTVRVDIPLGGFTWDISETSQIAGDTTFDLRTAVQNNTWDSSIEGLMVIEELPYDGATI